MKKILGFSLIILIILSLFTSVFASDLKTELKIIKKASDTKYLENDQGYIVSKIKNINKDIGELSVQVNLENKKKQTSEEQEVYENSEVFIIIPEYTDEKKNEKLTQIETLASKILEKSDKTKIGIIGIKGPISDTYIDEDGKRVERPDDQSGVKGTENDAECIVKLTNNLESLKTDLRNMNLDNKKYYNNLQAALRLARNSFSTNVNKILISLYDNVPSTAIGISNQGYSFGGLFSQYSTAEEAVRAHISDLVSKTKSEWISLKNAKVEFILLRPDNSNFDRKYYNSSTGEFLLEIDGKPYADELYGTLEKPTYGKMYSLNNDSFDKIVTEYIYSDVMKTIQPKMSNVVLKNYFSKDIVDNFDISISEANIANVDTTNLATENYITYNIGTIEGEKNAILEYTLKIKDMKNQNLLNKIINITEKTEISYIDYLDSQKINTLTSSPQIQLSEIKEEVIEEEVIKEEVIEENKVQDKDNTTATGKIPYTGASYAVILAVALILVIGIIAKVKYNDLKGIK